MTVITGRRRLLAAAGALLALAGCASLPVPDYRAGLGPLPAGRPARVELTDVPFFPQEDYQCGPAALATVLQAAGIARTPEELVEQVYLPQRQGSLQVEMLAGARRSGAVPYVLRGEPADLVRELAAGHPVVVLQNLRWRLLPQWHYAVVVGVHLAEGTVTLRSGTVRRLVMPLDEFDRSWALADRWSFVALPPDRLPASAREAEWVSAAANFERVAPALGPRAYETALAAWPRNLLARLALGNAAYRQRQLGQAREHYARATREHPEAGDAWNNLAQVLFEQGERDPALQAARRAVALGGPRADRYAATLGRIEAAGAP